MTPDIIKAEVALAITIQDPDRLYRSAWNSFTSHGGTQAEAEEWIGTAASPVLSNCLVEIVDGSIAHVAGMSTGECAADIHLPNVPRLRAIPMVAVSTGHLTPEELNRIEQGFDKAASEAVGTRLEHIVHDGLHLSPKSCGFYVMIPQDDYLTERLDGLTPEMRGIVQLAVSQGAIRIEFDADEELVDGLPEHEH